MLLTIEHHSHFGLEVVVSKLPKGKGLPGRILQHAEGDADGVFWGEACRVDKPGGREGSSSIKVQGISSTLLKHLNIQWT